MNIYYYANNIYQFSYAIPIYDKIGGTFLVRNRKCLAQFKLFLRGLNRSGEKTFLNSPKVKLISKQERQELEGVLIFCSNSISLKPYKKATTIFLEHGTGDKKYGGAKLGKRDPFQYAADKLMHYDYIFTSGKKNLERIKNMGIEIPERKLIKIGGTRFDEFLLGKYNREQELDRLKIKDRSRKNVLYAPTWKFGNGTLSKYIHTFIKEITQDYNLIVRTHYHDYKEIAKLKVWAKMKGYKHVYFSNPLDQIRNNSFHDFVASDLMISDISAVIYEYIIMDKPMILIQHKFEDSHDMPDELNAMKYASLYQEDQSIVEVIKESFNNTKRTAGFKELMNNCFYFNDGKSADRAVEFIKELPNEKL